VSGRSALPEDVIDAMATQEDTVTVLTLPLGMRRKAVLTSASQWRALDPVVALTTNPGEELDPDDITGLVDAGLPLTWISAMKSVVGALTAADRDQISAALSQTLPAGIQSLYAQKPSSSGGVEGLRQNPMPSRRRAPNRLSRRPPPAKAIRSARRVSMTSAVSAAASNRPILNG